MRARTAAGFGLLVLAGVASLFLIGEPERQPPALPPAASPSAANPEPLSKTRTGPPPRNVTPGGVLPGPQVTAPLVRLPGPPPPPAPVAPPAPARHHRVVVADAGSLAAGRLTLRLDAIKAPALSQTCPTRNGESWPCGQAAATALKRFIRTRAVECTYPDAAPHDGPELAARCRVAETDLATWLVSQGWARAEDGAQDLRQAEAEAKAARRGLWR